MAEDPDHHRLHYTWEVTEKPLKPMSISGFSDQAPIDMVCDRNGRYGFG